MTASALATTGALLHREYVCPKAPNAHCVPAEKQSATCGYAPSLERALNVGLAGQCKFRLYFEYLIQP
jgi:hypothetical protein